MKALIVVDMQNDFITGSLAVPRAEEIVKPIVDLIWGWGGRDGICFTADFHPYTHCSFKENGGQWPRHCVQGTSGASLHPSLDSTRIQLKIPVFRKGMNKDVEEYSGLANPFCRDFISGYDEVLICGLARDFCVQATAEDAAKLGKKVTILEDLCRSVN